MKRRTDSKIHTLRGKELEYLNNTLFCKNMENKSRNTKSSKMLLNKIPLIIGKELDMPKNKNQNWLVKKQ